MSKGIKPRKAASVVFRVEPESSTDEGYRITVGITLFDSGDVNLSLEAVASSPMPPADVSSS